MYNYGLVGKGGLLTSGAGKEGREGGGKDGAMVWHGMA